MAAHQHGAIHGSGNILVQLHGDHSSVNIQGAPYLVLTPWGRFAESAPVQSEIDLLRPFHRAIPLVGRDGDMESLWQWLHSERPISVRTVTGRAGAGKTRIAVDLMKRLGEDRGDSWHAGFATEQEMTRFSGQQNLSAWGWRQPTLIVLDYAGAHLKALWRWLHELALTPRGAGRPPLRLLLLERQASVEEGWYRGLQDASDSGAGVARLFDPLEPLPLQPLDAAADRRQVLQAMLEEGARFLKTASPPVPAPGQDPYFDRLLADEQWADPLYLMMAALVSLQHGLVVALALSRKDLAMRLADREGQRIRRYAGDPNCPEAALLAHMAAYVTLCGGLSEQDALEAARQECEALQRRHPNGPGALVELLREAMPGAPHLAALKPDIIGEALFLQVFGGRRIEAATRAVLRAARWAGDAVAASVLRAAQDFSYLDPARSNSEVRLEPLTWLEELIQAGQADNPGLLLAIDSAMPEHTLVLREQAARVCRLLIDRLAGVALDMPAERRAAEEARLRNNLGNRLSKLGRQEEALASAEEAVSIRRRLAAQRPATYLRYLATSLNNLGNRLSNLGRREEALASVDEAVGICRRLEAAQPGDFLRELAMSLDNLGKALSGLGRREEALASAEEAVGICRRLEAAQPGAFLRYLAGSLSNLGMRQSALGRREEALASAEEAVGIYRKLAAERPDSFLPDLATSLNNLGMMQRALGRREEALASAEEAVGIYRRLADEWPKAFLPYLARSLGALGTCLAGMGRHPEAARAFQEGLTALSPLFQKTPAAFGRVMEVLVGEYLREVEVLGQEPDVQLLTPVLETLQGLEKQGEKES